MVIESPSGLLKLLWMSTFELPGELGTSEPRIPGQHGGVAQLRPVIVPSTNVDCATEPTKMPNTGAGTPVNTCRYRSSYMMPYVTCWQTPLKANGGMHWRS